MGSCRGLFGVADLTIAIGLTLALGRCGGPTVPTAGSPTAVTYAFDAIVTDSCDFVSLQACTPAPFGLIGVAPGTTASGTLMIDLTSPVVSHLEQTGYASTTYSGATVTLTIGNSVLNANVGSLAKVEVDATEAFTQLVVYGTGGFKSGFVAGMPIHYFTLSLPVSPSRYPDTSLFADPTPLDQGARNQPDKAGFSVKYILDPTLRLPRIDLLAPGPTLHGRITSVHRKL